jgi:hypothetical protein
MGPTAFLAFGRVFCTCFANGRTALDQTIATSRNSRGAGVPCALHVHAAKKAVCRAFERARMSVVTGAGAV